MTRVAVEDLRVRCLIGVLDPERVHPQEVRVDLEVELDASAAARQDDLRLALDYGELGREVAFVLEEGRFHLLESASWVMVRWLLLPRLPGDARPTVGAARVRLTKFNRLAGRALAVVEHRSTAAAEVWTRESNPWGTVDVVAETRRMGLYRLNLAPGGSIPNHVHRHTREAELVLDRGLVGWRDGQTPTALAAGTRFRWPLGEAHGYHNPSDRTLSVLCIDAPPFDPADEVEVRRAGVSA